VRRLRSRGRLRRWRALDARRRRAMYGRAVAFGVANTRCSCERERQFGALRLLTLSALRLPDVALYGELLHSYVSDRRACCWRQHLHPLCHWRQNSMLIFRPGMLSGRSPAAASSARSRTSSRSASARSARNVGCEPEIEQPWPKANATSMRDMNRRYSRRASATVMGRYTSQADDVPSRCPRSHRRRTFVNGDSDAARVGIGVVARYEEVLRARPARA
jgi:hypothetical protein